MRKRKDLRYKTSCLFKRKTILHKSSMNLCVQENVNFYERVHNSHVHYISRFNSTCTYFRFQTNRLNYISFDV